MKYPSAKTMILCWDPNSSRVAMMPWPDPVGHCDKFQRTALAPYYVVRQMNFEQLKSQCFIEAMHLIVRDGCDPRAVHKALKCCAEYRDGCAEDMLRI